MTQPIQTQEYHPHPGQRLLAAIVAATVALFLLLAVAGCSPISSGGGRGVRVAQSASAEWETMPAATAKESVQRYADETVAAMGNARYDNRENDIPNPNQQHCEGLPKDVYLMIGIYRVEIPSGQALATLDRVRQHWTQAGHIITKERRLEDRGSGDMYAINPSSHYALSLIAAVTEDAFVLRVISPCYRSPTPLE